MTATREPRLWRASWRDKADAIPAFLDGRADETIFGFVYTPRDIGLVRRHADGTFEVRGRKGAPLGLALDDVFEMRLFCPAWELRWRRNGDEARVAVLSDENLTASIEQTFTPTAVRLLDNQYLVWGEPAKTEPVHAAGWTRLTTARIGALWVPLESARRVRVTTREYFAQPDSGFGNWVFLTERLTGFETTEE